MKLAVIVVYFNNDEYLFQSINSLKNCLVKNNRYEIVIVDNSPAGYDPEKLRECCLEQIKLVRERVNTGFGSANNFGVKNTNGELLAFVNPDIELKTDISPAIEYLKEHTNIGVLGIRLLNPDNSWQRSYGNFPTLWKKFCDALLLSRVFEGIKLFKGIHGYIEYTEPTEVDWVSGAFMIIRREAFEQVKGFDEDFFLYFEDVDLCRRIKEKGWKIVYYPYSEAIHYLGGESKLSSDFVIDHGDSPYIYFKKHLGKWSLPILWILIVGEALFKSFLFGSIGLLNKRYKSVFRMYRNTLKFSLFKSPIIMYKLINH